MINSTFEVFECLASFFALNCYCIFVTHRWNNLSNMQSIGLRNIMTQGLYVIAYNTWASLAYTGWTVSDNNLTRQDALLLSNQIVLVTYTCDFHC